MHAPHAPCFNSIPGADFQGSLGNFPEASGAGLKTTPDLSLTLGLKSRIRETNQVPL